MKTHEFATALNMLSRLLKAGPDIELAELRPEDLSRRKSSQELAVNLNTLISLSSVDKARWLDLIAEHKFPIDIRPRDGSRDVLGKLFSYLEDNPAAQERLKNTASRTNDKESPELMKALSTLLKGTTHHEPSADRDKS